MYSTTLEESRTERPHYDLPTAVTFLFAGLGLGYVCALLLAPRLNTERLDERVNQAENVVSVPKYRFP